MSKTDLATGEMRWEMPRLRAVFRQCQQLRPEKSACDCLTGACKLRGMLATTTASHQLAIQELEGMERELDRKPATRRADWVRPQPPGIGYFLAVRCDDDEWFPHWFSDSHSIDYIPLEGPEGWPFVEAAASTRDWQALGFTVFS